MAGLLITRQPFKSLYMLAGLGLLGVRIPFWVVYFIPSFLRQHPEWTYKQALMVRIVRAFLLVVSSAEHQPKTPRTQNKAKGWVIVSPARSDAYTGVVIADKQIKPQSIGGAWYPKTLEKYTGGEIVLHVHGGAFVIGDGLPSYSGFTAKSILKHTKATHVFFPHYRLSSRKGNRFPAALQDVITSYTYLTETLNIPASNITISGDSAGANLSLSLLRYITENPEAKLPNPGCAWLWSLWADPGRALIKDPPFFAANAHTDYLSDTFGIWGAETYKPRAETGITMAHPNICFSGTPFATATPIFFAVGEVEALHNDIVKSYDGLKAIKENKIELYIQAKAVHDIILVGNIVGFEKESDKAFIAANKFLESTK